MNITGPVVVWRYGRGVLKRLGRARELPPSEHAVPGRRGAEVLRASPAVGLGESVLRTGLALVVVVAGTNCVFALMAGAGALSAVEGIVLVAVAVAGVVRIDVAARLLRPKGRVVLLAGLFGLAGSLDVGLYDHFGGVAGVIVCIAAFVCAPRYVALCFAVCTVGYLGGLALHGSSLAWMVGDGLYVIVGHLVNFADHGAIGLLMLALLRRFLASAPQHLASLRADGRSLTPQLALAAGGHHVALLPAADARTLITPLTQGEREVVSLLASGRVSKQVAHDLTIALATVRSRIASAKHKTGARTLPQLVAMYTEAELAA